ncbi:molybdate ABC transporter substrate-binding protein [Desulfotalea psychrophila]|uniref:Probable molybdenum ABC transporter, substrate binding periplasmic protein (ModA) n=1 Tax=Desulfotalea psychrophila (strain LSv54 / DSM 12343) TaxID=177439 RepID=Q6AR38_DESPS|nr:molybdate ABC transporter substrate-binding protein [Desulfotalea psychrophila]CAG35186.1 probable molybdenum ABC transporter, substrate binding periplasmic protein (ModA) [Desulfotalea psychrophila LSv54]
MKRGVCFFCSIIVLSFLLVAGSASAEQIRVAVASNFTGAIKEIASSFQAKTSHKVVLLFGSTGKHYAQIKNGAPFDAFFAADVRRPKLLEEEGLAVAGTRFTYAMGTLVLWSADPQLLDDSATALKEGRFHHLAFANPKLAPYGKASQQVLENLGLWKQLQPKFVRGENISQALQFIKSGNAELGFIALSQLKSGKADLQGSLWKVPVALYSPIEQQAVLLRDNKVAAQFLEFAKGEEALKIIRGFGYSCP